MALYTIHNGEGLEQDREGHGLRRARQRERAVNVRSNGVLQSVVSLSRLYWLKSYNDIKCDLLSLSTLSLSLSTATIPRRSLRIQRPRRRRRWRPLPLGSGAYSATGATPRSAACAVSRSRPVSVSLPLPVGVSRVVAPWRSCWGASVYWSRERRSTAIALPSTTTVSMSVTSSSSPSIARFLMPKCRASRRRPLMPVSRGPRSPIRPASPTKRHTSGVRHPPPSNRHPSSSPHPPASPSSSTPSTTTPFSTFPLHQFQYSLNIAYCPVPHNKHARKPLPVLGVHERAAHASQNSERRLGVLERRVVRAYRQAIPQHILGRREHERPDAYARRSQIHKVRALPAVSIVLASTYSASKFTRSTTTFSPRPRAARTVASTSCRRFETLSSWLARVHLR